MFLKKILEWRKGEWDFEGLQPRMREGGEEARVQEASGGGGGQDSPFGTHEQASGKFQVFTVVTEIA